jgi:hypothetical protein
MERLYMLACPISNLVDLIGRGGPTHRYGLGWPDLLPIGLARKRTLGAALTALVAFAARVRVLGIAGRLALPAVTDHVGSARRETFAASLDALHPYLPWMR